MTILFSTHEYEMNHGKAPRGAGHWAFIDALHARKANYLDFVFWTAGTFAEAKKAARAHFATVKGFSGDVVVLS